MELQQRGEMHPTSISPGDLQVVQLDTLSSINLHHPHTPTTIQDRRLILVGSLNRDILQPQKWLVRGW